MSNTASDRVALVVTGRREVGTDVAAALEHAGYRARVASGFEHLDLHADRRPLLVVTDLSLRPSRSDWSRLEQEFPDSVLWALVNREGTPDESLLATVKQGCQDYVVYPIDSDELYSKLHRLDRWCHSGSSGPALDPYLTTEIRLDVPSDASLIEHVVRHVASQCRDFRGFAPRTLVNLRIALSEALSNAMIYGNRQEADRRVQVHAHVDAFRIEVKVVDEGPGFELQEIPDPTRPDALESPGGRGLFLLHKLADEVEYNECGNSVTLIFRSERDTG